MPGWRNGRRASLRSWWGKPHESSNLSLGTRESTAILLRLLARKPSFSIQFPLMDANRSIGAFLARTGKTVFRDLITVCEIPSPTFHEKKKTKYLATLMKSLGLLDVHIDAQGNAIGILSSQSKPKHVVLLSAHTDTVCEVPGGIHVRDDGKHLHGHGICDNTAGIATIITFLRYVKDRKPTLNKDYLVAFTVGEEGLGAKRGMRAVMKKYASRIRYVVNSESHDIGRVTNACIGQYRAALTVTTKQRGGHSWHDFGEPNAAVVLSAIIRDLSLLRLPKKTSVNVTALSGGKNINVIPSDAACMLEFRSSKQSNIAPMLTKLKTTLRRHAKQDVTCTLEVLSETVAASASKAHPLYRITRQAQRSLGIKSFFSVGNTDGDVPLALGIPTVTVGSSNGFATHSLKEHLEKKTFLTGVQQVLSVILALDERMST